MSKKLIVTRAELSPQYTVNRDYVAVHGTMSTSYLTYVALVVLGYEKESVERHGETQG